MLRDVIIERSADVDIGVGKEISEAWVLSVKASSSRRVSTSEVGGLALW